MPDRLLSPKQAAEELGVSIWSIYRLIRKGDLVAIRVGRLLRIPESSLEAFLDLKRVRVSLTE
ncbi:MAG: helix-turn-helix domain-containing protein [Thaumarchaeota archaeon]|nr:helix-turn-helix domain-containing protein [Nitrososphaerota archaeon]